MKKHRVLPRAIIHRATAFGLGLALLAGSGLQAQAAKLLNVSYDPTRELYQEFDAAFAAHWKATTGEDIKIEMSHGGSGKQARAVVDGLPADVVTLALAADINQIAGLTGKLPEDWQTRLPYNSSPYTSTIVLVVRKGNPKQIKDWGDLAKPDVQVITPNPKTSGGARWNFLAAWAYGLKEFGGDTAKTREYITALFRNVPVLDTGARGSTTTFAQRDIGDVMISWENEAYLIQKEFPGQFEIIVPSISILAEPPVAVVDQNAAADGVEKQAKAYLEYLYSAEGQKIIAKNFYRPRKPEFADPKDVARFQKLDLVTIDKDFGGWRKAQKEFFNDGGVFDQIYKNAQ